MESSTIEPSPSPNQPEHESQSLLSQGQGDRLDRWVEFFSAVILALATVLTAWCGYQAARWGGVQTQAYGEASTARVMASGQTNLAMLRGSIHVGLFTAYASAFSEDNQKLADFLYERFPAELKVATDAWLATDPLHNPKAPLSPFDMPEYKLPQNAEAARLEALAEQKAAEGDRANDLGDQYMLMTVIFAMALFFAGISGKFQWSLIDLAMLALGVLVIIGGLWFLLKSPIG